MAESISGSGLSGEKQRIAVHITAQLLKLESQLGWDGVGLRWDGWAVNHANQSTSVIIELWKMQMWDGYCACQGMYSGYFRVGLSAGMSIK